MTVSSSEDYADSAFEIGATRYGYEDHGTVRSSANLHWGDWYHIVYTFEGGDPGAASGGKIATSGSQRLFINGE